jgi:hypothetical protein
MAYGGNMGDPTAALQAMAAQTRGQMEDVGASIREQYGAMGLGAGTDVSEAVARGMGRELANLGSAQQQLWLQNFNQAQDRALQGQAMLPSYAQALNMPGMQQQAMRLGANQALTGLGGQQGTLLSQVGSQLLGNSAAMANIGQGYGQLGAINSAATGQLGNLWGQAAGLSNAAMGTGLQSGYNMAMANPQLGLQAAALRNEALGQWSPAMSLWNQAQLGGANTLSQLGAYDMALQEGNVNRAWQNWQLGQQPRFLNEAISYATGFPPALQKPIVQNQSGVSSLGGLFGGIGSMLAALPFVSDRNLKTGFRAADLQAVLQGVESLNIEEWEYLFDPRTRHIGPMAQDWKQTFGVGSGVTIDAVDAIGVLLASVKALAQRVRELEARNAEAR